MTLTSIDIYQRTASINDPDMLALEVQQQVVNVGPVYRTRPGDSFYPALQKPSRLLTPLRCFGICPGEANTPIDNGVQQVTH